MLLLTTFLTTFNQILHYRFWGNSLKNYFLFLLALGAVFLFLRLLRHFSLQKLEKISQKTKNRIDNFLFNCLHSIHWLFYLVISLWIACRFLTLPPTFFRYFNYFILIIIVFSLVKISEKFIDYGTQKLVEERKEKGEETNLSFINLINKVLRFLLWTVALLLLLQNLGFEVTALITSLGIGGVAIAFALQAVLGDFLAYFSIHLDKPFQVGDFITIGEEAGSIQRIGLRSTRLSALTGEELIISNQELTSKKIHNYKRMKERRVAFHFGVEYKTTASQLKKILSIIEDIFENLNDARLSRAHFKELGNSSLIFEVVYYVLTADYNQFMDVRQKINLELKSRLEKEKIEFAYPTQTIHLQQK
jgi:small-conductance mechanosensitive channel